MKPAVKHGRERRWARLIVFLSVLIVLAAACSDLGMGIPLGEPPGTLEPTVTPFPTSTPLPLADPRVLAQVYLDAWQAEDYPTMYAWLSTLSQDALDEADFIQRYREVAAKMSLESLTYEIRSALTKERTAQIAYRVTFQTMLVGEISRETLMTLTLEGGQWRVQWDDGMILPELHGGNLLWMDYRVPSRSNIYDIKGRALVAQADAVSIGLIAGEIDPLQQYDLFNEIWLLTGETPEEIQEKLSAYKSGWYLPIGEAASDRVAERYGILEGYAGLVMEPFRARYYFNGGVSPQVIGYVSSIQPQEVEAYARLGYQQDERVGRMGLEQWAEPYLAGKHGGILYVVEPDGKVVTRLAESQSAPSQAVFTTLDRDLQIGAQAALEGFIGAVVVMERDTGRILAMASSPGFDPNLFEPTNYNSSFLLEDLLTDSDTPLLNRATQGQYPLGSVFKIVTMAAALESGMFTVNSTYYCGHTFDELEGTTRYDWTYSFGAPPSGLLDLPGGLMRSCNPWFWHIGLDLFDQGLDKYVAQMAEAFGLGQPTGLQEVVEETGGIPYPQNRVDAINFAIGQGDTLVTPLQVARFIAAIGNGGTLLRPQVIDKIGPPGETPTFVFSPEPMGQLPITPETLAALRAAMESVVADPKGTAYWRFINFQVPIAGKTGTAEAPPREPHAWFAGYTFAEDPDRPDVAAVVIMEHGGEGSVVAAPVFKRLMELYFIGQAVTPLPWEVEVELPPPPEGTEP